MGLWAMNADGAGHKAHVRILEACVSKFSNTRFFFSERQPMSFFVYMFYITDTSDSDYGSTAFQAFVHK